MNYVWWWQDFLGDEEKRWLKVHQRSTCSPPEGEEYQEKEKGILKVTKEIEGHIGPFINTI